MISIGKRATFRASRSQTPIFDALLRAMMEFGKAGIGPSKIHRVEIAPEVFDALLAENKHNGSYAGEWLEIAGLRIYRGEP